MDKNRKRMETMHRMRAKGLELFYQKGYHATSIDDILNELSLSKGAFYHHFKSNLGLFHRGMVPSSARKGIVSGIRIKNSSPMIEKHC